MRADTAKTSDKSLAAIAETNRKLAEKASRRALIAAALAIIFALVSLGFNLAAIWLRHHP